MTAKRILAYRGTLQPLHTVNGVTLSRSLKNGNYYLTRGTQEPQMTGALNAADWLRRHGLPLEADMERDGMKATS